MPRTRNRVAILWNRRREQGGLNYAALRWTNPETGKREILETLGFVTPEDAEDARQDHEAALRLGVSLPAGDAVLVGDVLDCYLNDLEYRAVGEGHQNCEVNRSGHLHRHLGHLRADAVSSITLSRYQGDRSREPTRLGMPPKSGCVRDELKMLRRSYRVADEARLIDCRPPQMPRGKVAKDSRPPRRLTEDEVRRLVTTAHRLEAHPGFGHYIATLAWSGRRPVAVQALQAGHASRLRSELPREEQLVYWVKDKGGVGRGWGPVSEPARQALVAQAEAVGDGLLFITGRGQAMTSNRARRAFQMAAAEAGVPDVQPYDLRRFAVTRIIKAVGGQLDLATRFTGHRNVQTLLRYSFATQNEAELAAVSIGWSGPALRAVE